MSVRQSFENNRVGKGGRSTCADDQHFGWVFYRPIHIFECQTGEFFRPPGLGKQTFMKTEAAMVAILSDDKAVILVAAEKV